MKKIDQRFKDRLLEQKYQNQRGEQLQKPIFYSFIIVSGVMNGISLVTELINFEDEIPYTSIIGFGVILMQVLIAFKFQQYIKYALTIYNLLIPLYQLTLDENFVRSQEIFSYGCSFTIFSAVISFASDFQMSSIQIFFNLLTRQIITIYYSSRVDYINLFLNISAAIFLIITIYKFEKISRSQFLMNEKESLFLQQSLNFIFKPHFLIQFSRNTKFFNITYMYKCQEYDLGETNFCYGCFGRHFLRNSIIKNSKINLEQILLQEERVSIQNIYEIRYGKINLQIKIAQYGYLDTFVIIINKGLLEKIQNNKISVKVIETFQNYFNQIDSKVNFHKMIKIGMASLLLINSQKIKNINITKSFRRITKEFQLEKFIHIKSFSNQNDSKTVQSQIKMFTFSNQIRIFWIQVLIISQTLVQNGETISFLLFEYEDFVNLSIKLIKQKEFLEKFHSNCFIESTSEYIIFEPLNNNLELKFRKKIPFFIQQKLQLIQ